jgi:hypothetical protein
MARLEWVILTERTIIEEHTHNVSLQSIVETITIPPPPPEMLQPPQPLTIPFRFYVNQQWARSKRNIEERVMGRVLLLGPNNKLYGQSDFEVDLVRTGKAHVIGQVMAFPLLGEGDYPVRVQVRQGTHWRTVGETQFAVMFNAQLGAGGIPQRH